MATAMRLERQRGHFFNWYDTRTLEPDLPRFISTVDSGNLVASLITLQRGALELLKRPLLSPALLDGYADQLCALAEMKLIPKRVVAGFEDTDEKWLRRLLTAALDMPAVPEGMARAEDAYWFRAQTRDLVEQVRDTVMGVHAVALPEFEPLQSNAALGNLRWHQELTLEKLPAFIDLLHGKLLLAQGGRERRGQKPSLRDRLRGLLPAAKARDPAIDSRPPADLSRRRPLGARDGFSVPL